MIKIPLWAVVMTMALTSLDARAYEIWVTNQRTNRVQIINGASLKLVYEIDAGGKPHNITLSRDGKRAYVANLRSGDFSVIDTALRKVLATVPAGKTTHHVAVSPDDRLLFVTIRGEDAVAVYDAERLTRVKTIAVGRGPAMVVFTPDGKKAYLSNGRDATVSVIDVAKMEVVAALARIGGWTTASVISRDGKRVVVTGGEGDKYAVIDTMTDRVIAEAVSGKDPHGAAVTPDGRHALITNLLSNDVSIVDFSGGEIIGTISNVGDKPSNIAISPDGKRAFITLIGERVATDPPNRLSGKDAGVSIIDLVSKKVLARIPLDGDPYDIAVKE